MSFFVTIIFSFTKSNIGRLEKHYHPSYRPLGTLLFHYTADNNNVCTHEGQWCDALTQSYWEDQVFYKIIPARFSNQTEKVSPTFWCDLRCLTCSLSLHRVHVTLSAVINHTKSRASSLRATGKQSGHFSFPEAAHDPNTGTPGSSAHAHTHTHNILYGTNTAF